MIKTYYIYEIINPNSQSYIGVTTNMTRRKNQYKSLKDRKHGLISESISFYGFDKHTFNQIDQMDGSFDEAQSLEIFWIRTKMSNVNRYAFMNGLNLTDGGKGLLGGKFTKESKEKMSIKHLGKKLSSDHIKKLTESNARHWLGKARSSETKIKISLKHKGKKLSNDHKYKLSQSHKGQISAKRKPIVQYDKYGNYINEHHSLKDAANALGIKSITGISNVLTGRSRFCKGYVFKYKEV